MKLQHAANTGLKPVITDAEGSSFTAILNGNNCQNTANLFCAAPDLLKACKTMLSLLEDHEPTWYLKRHYNILITAIDKAERRN